MLLKTYAKPVSACVANCQHNGLLLVMYALWVGYFSECVCFLAVRAVSMGCRAAYLVHYTPALQGTFLAFANAGKFLWQILQTHRTWLNSYTESMASSQVLLEVLEFVLFDASWLSNHRDCAGRPSCKLPGIGTNLNRKSTICWCHGIAEVYAFMSWHLVLAIEAMSHWWKFWSVGFSASGAGMWLSCGAWWDLVLYTEELSTVKPRRVQSFYLRSSLANLQAEGCMLRQCKEKYLHIQLNQANGTDLDGKLWES